jgi:hypothetical protein
MNETASEAAGKALEVAEQAKAKAAEVSTLAIAKALEAATLAATKAADAASAAATIAASTSKDLEYIKKDIADTKADVKEIKDKLDEKYVTRADFLSRDVLIDRMVTKEEFSLVRIIVYGMCALMLSSVIGGLMYLIINKGHP